MSIWAIADLHLSFGVPNKEMEFFGEEWKGYTDKIATFWHDHISPNDLILIAGDISWAMHPIEAKPDLDWIDHLPGTKVILRGNHDYWWSSLNKIQEVLPPSIHLIQNNVFHWNDYSIVGARLWDTKEYTFHQYIDFQENPRFNTLIAKELSQDADKIFNRELGRLELSLKCLDKESRKTRIAMTHYPPISADLRESSAAKLLEKYHIDTCVFGHLHRVKPHSLPFGEKNGVRYILTSADYLNFEPLKIYNYT